MKKRLLIAGLALTAACSQGADAGATTLAQSFSAEITHKLGYRYTITLPDGYAADAAKRWPLVLFLHGAGERGDNLELLKKHGPPKLVAAGKKFEAVVVAPQVPSGSFWNPHGVKALVDQLRAQVRLDEKRLYITGISMGGFGTFDTITEYPELFAAAIPICGGAGINIVKWDARVTKLPIWIFHGAKDATVPPAFSEMAYNRLKSAKGHHAKYTVYPEAKHDSWTETYDNPEVWTWLFAQKRD